MDVRDIVVVIEGQEGVTWEEWRRLAEACERVPLGGLFTSDHYLSEVEPTKRPALDAWAVLSGLAAITRSVRLGTIVTPVTFRHPAVLAKTIVTVDHLSGGRVELGLGAGWYEEEHRAYGFSFPKLSTRLQLLREYGVIIRGLTGGGLLRQSETGYELVQGPGLPAPIQRKLRIIVGGTGKSGTTAPAAEFADEYNSLETSIESCRRIRDSLDEACNTVQRDPATLSMSLSLKCVVGTTGNEIQRRLERAHRLMLSALPTSRPTIDEGWLVGLPAEIAQQLHELQKIGISRVFLRFVDHQDTDAIGLLGAEIGPALRSLEGRGSVYDS